MTSNNPAVANREPPLRVGASAILFSESIALESHYAIQSPRVDCRPNLGSTHTLQPALQASAVLDELGSEPLEELRVLAFPDVQGDLEPDSQRIFPVGLACTSSRV